MPEVKPLVQPAPVPLNIPTTLTQVTPSPVQPDPLEAKMYIYHKESGNVPCKINGGAIDCNYSGNLACGIGQSLPCSKLTSVCTLADYVCQDTYFTQYMTRRYGSWNNAKIFWDSHHWW